MNRTLPELIEQLTTRAACPSDITDALTEIDRRLTALERTADCGGIDEDHDKIRAALNHDYTNGGPIPPSDLASLAERVGLSVRRVQWVMQATGIAAGWLR